MSAPLMFNVPFNRRVNRSGNIASAEIAKGPLTKWTVRDRLPYALKGHRSLNELAPNPFQHADEELMREVERLDRIIDRAPDASDE